ncbi:hypothetical protein BCR44DRAFT_315105 [Catenaria anguillulae PL171]|uniref:Uncharacterized protein n=1 Tax=Catenaria anguillulae PL171 TaxID=765915 RepID=A0A1Y2HK56_9FUNG|nr:hypothetical protein BCR44DRAFT_315105 [Catenaria anguillulae PL171]
MVAPSATATHAFAFHATVHAIPVRKTCFASKSKFIFRPYHTPSTCRAHDAKTCSHLSLAMHPPFPTFPCACPCCTLHCACHIDRAPAHSILRSTGNYRHQKHVLLSVPRHTFKRTSLKLGIAVPLTACLALMKTCTDTHRRYSQQGFYG